LLRHEATCEGEEMLEHTMTMTIATTLT